MDDPASIHTLLLLLLTVCLVLLNGFFVAAEFAIVKVRSTRIKELVEDGSVSAKYASTALRELSAYLSATQLGITLASLGIGWIGEPLVAARLVQPLFHILHVHAARDCDPGVLRAGLRVHHFRANHLRRIGAEMAGASNARSKLRCGWRARWRASSGSSNRSSW